MKTGNFKIVKLDYHYCDFLRQYDSRVPYNAGIKEMRPFIGVLFMVDEMEYFAPLSSPKAKHYNLKNTVDLIKIKDGKQGVINLNNMIPVTKNCYELFDLNGPTETISEKKHQSLLRSQLRWLNSNKVAIKGKAIRLYDNYRKKRLPKRIMERCCDFPLLEKKCSDYLKELIK